MTGAKYIKQAMIAALCEHPEQEKYRARAFAGANLPDLMNVMAEQGGKLTKEDFMSPDDDGKYIIDTAGFWRNFSKIRGIVENNGGRFELADFLKTMGENESRTLLESAIRHGAVKDVFTFDVWKGRFDDMEHAWYLVDIANRRAHGKNDGMIDPFLKRDLLRAEGREMPEDKLAAAGVTSADIKNAFRPSGSLDALDAKFRQSGDRLRKEYVLLPDNDAYHVFFHKEDWAKYEEFSRMLFANGDRFEAKDLLRRRGNRLPILAVAAQHGHLDKVFNPSHWTGRLQEMLELWSYCLDGWKVPPMETKDFDRFYAVAENRTYIDKVDFNKLETFADLRKPLVVDDAAADAKPVYLMGLRSFWEKYSEITGRLQGEGLTTDDLRVQSGALGDRCMLTAAKCGCFAEVIRIARDSGKPLQVSDFLDRDRHGNTLLDTLAERRELALAFTPELWVGRVADMKSLWMHVRDRKQIDFAEVEGAVKQATLRQQSKNKFKMPPR